MGAASKAGAGEKIPSIFRLWRVPCVATARGWEEAFAGCSVMVVSLYAEQASEMTACERTLPRRLTVPPVRELNFRSIDSELAAVSGRA